MKIISSTTGKISFSVFSLRIRFSYCPLHSKKYPLGNFCSILSSFACASATVLPKSLSRTLNSTVPRSKAFSELIIGGPSVIFISATDSNGIGPKFIVCTCKRLRSPRLFLKSCPNLAFTEKRWRPSTVVVSFIPFYNNINVLTTCNWLCIQVFYATYSFQFLFYGLRKEVNGIKILSIYFYAHIGTDAS